MYRNNLSGEMAFKSFLPTPLSDIQIIHTEKIDNLIRNVEKAIYNLNTYSDGLSEKQIQQLIKQEAEYSCKLALDGLLLPFEFAINTTSELEEDTKNLLQAIHYVLQVKEELPLSARMLKNAHYLICNNEKYNKKYPGDFRTSPIWIGKKGCILKDALFIPPIYEDMIEAFSVSVDAVYNNNFIISADLILKCCLVLFNDNIKFQVANFNSDSVSVFDKNWDRIKESIEVAFELLKKWGFNDSSLRAKNAIIPIVYYIYHKNLEKEILKDHIHQEEKMNMRKWLCISLLKGVFGGQSDSVLSRIRKVLKDNIIENRFPFEQIKAEFASDDAKSLSLSDEVIDDILKTQKDAPDCYTILTLLYSHLQYDKVIYHKDHLHPASKFNKLKESDFSDSNKYTFYKNPENWNSILNLQLLSGASNESKNDEDLKDWVKDNNIDLASHLIPLNTSLDFNDFVTFINERKKLLLSTLKSIIGG